MYSRKFSKVWTCRFWDVRADLQTDMLITVLYTPRGGKVKMTRQVNNTYFLPGPRRMTFGNKPLYRAKNLQKYNKTATFNIRKLILHARMHTLIHWQSKCNKKQKLQWTSQKNYTRHSIQKLQHSEFIAWLHSVVAWCIVNGIWHINKFLHGWPFCGYTVSTYTGNQPPKSTQPPTISSRAWEMSPGHKAVKLYGRE